MERSAYLDLRFELAQYDQCITALEDKLLSILAKHAQRNHRRSLDEIRELGNELRRMQENAQAARTVLRIMGRLEHDRLAT